MITLGNIAVVMVIASAVSGWSRNSRYFLLSLTGADSAFGLLIMPLNLCVSFMKEYNEGPDPFCHVVAFFNATIYSTCMYTLATISLERYIAVFYPLKYSTVLTRRRALLLISFAWIFPPLLLVPISFPAGIIEVHFSRASLVCNPLYSSNVTYSLTLTCFIFFPCSAIMTFCNLRLWIAAKRQRLKLRRHSWGGGYRPKVALRVLVPVMTVYYTCWTPCMVIMLYNGEILIDNHFVLFQIQKQVFSRILKAVFFVLFFFQIEQQMDALHKQKAAQYKKTAEVSIPQRAKHTQELCTVCILPSIRAVAIIGG